MFKSVIKSVVPYSDYQNCLSPVNTILAQEANYLFSSSMAVATSLMNTNQSRNKR